MCHTRKLNKPTSTIPTTWMYLTFNRQLRIQTVPSTSTAASASNVAAVSAAAVSRRPVLSVRRRIINTPTSASFESGTQIAELPTTMTTTSKYNRLRGKLATTAATATTTTLTTIPAAAAAAPAATSNKNSNSYLSKFKAKSSSANVEPATLVLATLLPATSNNSNNKFQAALRRQFQTRRLTTTASPSSADESATDVPRTQNPLFKRRPTLTSTLIPQRPTTTMISIERTTVLDGIEIDGEDQEAKSSIHTSRFNQIPDQIRPRLNYELPTTTTTTAIIDNSGSNAATTNSSSSPFLVNNIRRQLVPRPRQPQSVTPVPRTTATSVTAALSPPLSRRQQSRRRPHKYIEVYSRPPSKPAVTTATSVSKRRTGPSVDYEYYDYGHASNKQQTQRRNGLTQAQMQAQSPQVQSQPKVIVHGRGIIECLEQGNFPHPLSCRKFISCAKFEETGGIVGWEYTCPKGLGYDGLSGMCTWAAPNSEGRACR